MRAWIRGELLRYAKRSSAFLAFDSVQRAFIRRLLERGYKPAYLQPIFDEVSFDDRWHFLAKRVATTREPDRPAVVALTLPNTQKVDAMKLRRVLFTCAERWLTTNEAVPLEVRQASFTLARTTIGKLAALLIDYRFPRNRFDEAS